MRHFGGNHRHVLILHRAIQYNVLGPEGQNMQAQVWNEILEVLEQTLPEIRAIAKPSAV